MSLQEVLARYAGPSDQPDRRVLLLPAAQVLSTRVPAAKEWTPDDAADAADAATPRVLIDLFPQGNPVAQVADLVAKVGDRDIAVVLLASGADTLPVGPLVTGLTAAGLRVVQVESIRIKEARTVAVVTRDPAVPRRSYLIGAEVGDDEPTQQRLANEWLVEQFQLRSRVGTSERRIELLESQVRTLTEERDVARASLATSSRALAALEDTTRKQRAAIRQLESAGVRGLGRTVKRAARILKDDPVAGSGRLAKAAGRRLRSR
jgi:hypothetical protein